MTAWLQAQAIAGDALVFLPGWDDISTLKDSLEAAHSPFRSSYFMVLPLHSQIAPEEQKRVFQVLHTYTHILADIQSVSACVSIAPPLRMGGTAPVLLRAGNTSYTRTLGRSREGPRNPQAGRARVLGCEYKSVPLCFPWSCSCYCFPEMFQRSLLPSRSHLQWGCIE